ncbi:MAG: hydroxyacid dehydrogenase [Gammaproteobacteria bacterium]|nr:hydroxyacid dehydrogenase [Gammaproteobacteria bacterium]|tara:strand:+ start:3139 stop:4146 length:1008 start_codon:yes stop_codon:yes gene_type:complete
MAKMLRTALVMHPVVRDELIRDDHMERLARAVDLVSPEPVRSFDVLGVELGRIEVLITSWGAPPVGPEVIERMPKLKLIAHLAGSVKGFLDDIVWRRGILVTNAVAANAVPVAEYTLAAILFANKKVLQLNRAYLAARENRAPWAREAPDVGNYRKTVGIVGASQVGRLVIRHLRAFDLDVLLYDPYVPPLAARDMRVSKVTLSELLARSDVVSLHAPLLPETRHMLGSRELALMPDGATLINTARGALVDPAALEAELARGRLFAVLDTTEPEVLPPDSPLYGLPNVFLTPHIAGSLGRETQRLADYIVAEVERFARGVSLKHLVRRELLPRLA